MREMKDSGVEWIGEIPANWKIIRLKGLFDFGKGLPITKENLIEMGIPVISYGQIHAKFNNGVNIDDRLFRFVSNSYLQTNSNALVNFGDILIADTSEDLEGCRNAVQIDRDTTIFAGYHTIILQSKRKRDNKYLAYEMLTDMWRSQLRSRATGVKLFSISRKMLGECIYIYPPIEDQQKIAAHLDRKSTQIDALISNAQQQIEKLKAYKQSVITETVTKGLDPDVKMKDSGVEWIGEIPEHWTVAPIRSFFKIKKDIIGHEPDTVLSITQGGIKVKDINENSGQMANSYAHYQIVNIGDFAMNHMDLLTGGVGISEFEGVTSPDYRVFVMRNADMNPRYFLYVFQMYYRNKIFYAFGQGAANLGRWRLPAQNFNTVAVPLSPVEEQNNIVTFLEEKCSQIDKLIDLKQQKIEKLQKYKKSLIYEYVTGKKEV